jgi:hypothetical protein
VLTFIDGDDIVDAVSLVIVPPVGSALGLFSPAPTERPITFFRN